MTPNEAIIFLNAMFNILEMSKTKGADYTLQDKMIISIKVLISRIEELERENGLLKIKEVIK